MCCTYIDDKIEHKSFPIMLGSLIDYIIRGDTQKMNPLQFGSFILDGEYKILPNFLMNNINHIGLTRITKANKLKETRLKWNIKNGIYTYRLNYDEKAQTSMLRISDNTAKRSVPIENWVDIINTKLTPFKHTITPQPTSVEYEYVFREIIKNFPHIDDLANKVLITGPILLERVRESIKNPSTRKSTYINGNMFFLLSKQQQIVENSHKAKTAAIKNFCSLYIPMDGQKHDKIIDFIPTIKRGVHTKQTMNIEPLKFPSDGEDYICPLSCKEMKDAGKTLNLAQYVITSLAVQNSTMNDYFREIDNPSAKYTVVINGFITPYKINFTFDLFVVYKRALLFPSFFLYNDFVYVVNVENIMLKFYSNFQIFVSPYEKKIFYSYLHPAYTNSRHKYCTNLQKISDNFLHTQPSKLSVTINNMKGSCTVLDSDESTKQFLSATGYNAAIVLDPIRGTDYTHLAHLKPPCRIPSRIAAMHNDVILPPINNLLLNNFQHKSDSFDPRSSQTTSVLNQIFEHCFKNSQCTTTKKRKKQIKVGYAKDVLINYSRMLHDELQVRKIESHQIKLYTAFNVLGPTVEDGFILDKDVAEKGPDKILSITLNIKIMKKQTQITRININKFKITYTPINELRENVIIFGNLTSLTDLRLTQNKKIVISSQTGKNEFRYLITYPLDQYSTTIMHNISSHFNNKTCSINIHFDYRIKLGIGTKLCNQFGQKCEISDIQDLSKYAGYDAQGNYVKPQIIMSTISIIGRLAAGQCRQMMSHPQRAFTETGGIIAPLEYTIHNIDASMKISRSNIRNDLMTNQAGFDCNELSRVASILTAQNSTNNANDILQQLTNLLSSRSVTLTIN
jgi:hypothetical protein